MPADPWQTHPQTAALIAFAYRCRACARPKSKANFAATANSGIGRATKAERCSRQRLFNRDNIRRLGLPHRFIQSLCANIGPYCGRIINMKLQALGWGV